MKKVFTTLFAAVLLASSFTCMAAETPQQASDATATLAEAETYAYLDLDSASPAMKEKILASRNTIIYSKDWVADGHTGYVTDVVTGEIIEPLPSFSSLFPDWDLPVNTAASPALSLEPPFESASRVIEQKIAKANQVIG